MLAARKLILSLALALSASAGPLLYVSTYNDFTGAGKFGTLDPATGAFNQIGPTLSDPLGGLVLGPNGYLGVSFSGNLDSVNPATGAVSLIGATGLGGYAFGRSILRRGLNGSAAVENELKGDARKKTR